MLIQGSVNTSKTDLLIERYVNLIKSGVNVDEILVITLNPYKKAQFIEKVQKLNRDIDVSKFKIYTLFGLCYNAFLDNWAYISKLIKNAKEKPNLCGLEVSQYIFKQCIKEGNFSDYISKVNLLHQLFRRYSLIVLNNFSDSEIKQRSEILKESFYIDAQKALEDYKVKTIEYNSFDYLRQMSVLPLIYKNTDYFKNIKYFFADDADEMPYIFWQFIDAIKTNLSGCYIGCDKNGTSRQGYLGAYKSGIKDYISKYNPKIQNLEDKSTFRAFADEFYYKIQNGEKTNLKDITFYSSLNRLNMFDEVFNKINELLQKGVKPSEIAVITPLYDEVLLQNFSGNKFSIKFQFLSGSQKLVDDPDIRNIITILKLINKIDVNVLELKNLLINFLKIPYRKCITVLAAFEKTKELQAYNFIEENYDYAYKKFLSLINSFENQKLPLYEQIRIICLNLEIEVKDFLIKEAQSFEAAFKNLREDLVKDFIIQTENSIISENSSEVFKSDPKKVLVSTAQKLIDYSVKTKYQFWLDISDNEWTKEDSGTLYNAWVFNRDYNKTSFTFEDNLKLTRQKTAAIVRKLMLCAQDGIFFFASIYNNNGNENFGGLIDYITTEENTKSQLRISPRFDQKPVLEYKKGRLGIAAVPGAGKTTILLALVIKLINEGINSENIFVLTYMESAAKNFKERLKTAIPDSLNLPNISTIHGLALRIIKENSNYTKIGLDDNFDICDDLLKEKIIKEIFYKLKIKDENYDNYLRCLSLVKLSLKDDLESIHKDIKDFYKFYEEYNSLLKQNNLIDYDDMLFYAVKILQENKEILEYYQNLCRYIIEDEAQDSTKIQQVLLGLLSGKYKNLVRCGDINQAITSSFTNSDTQGFRLFLNQNKKVLMTSSQRCAKPIYELANSIVKNKDCIQAFYDMEIHGTPDNPKNTEAPKYFIFETEKEEKTFILNKIQEILNKNSKASVAILLRLNSQVNEFNEFFTANNIKTSVRTDCLGQKYIFKIIFYLLKILQSPLNNKCITEFAEILPFINQKDLQDLKSFKEPFILINPDDIISEGLSQLYWDIDYFLNMPAASVSDFALKIGRFYSRNDTDRANTYIISSVIYKLSLSYKDKELINQLEYISNKPLSMFKLFEDEYKQDISGINIMTVHKSKGDEFDYVFIAQMHEDNFPTIAENVKLKSGGHFYQTIKSLTENTVVKTPDLLKREQAQETLRLIYVGVTRAKKQLFITASKSYMKNKKVKLSKLFEKYV